MTRKAYLEKRKAKTSAILPSCHTHRQLLNYHQSHESKLGRRMNIDELRCFRKYLNVQVSLHYFLHKNLNIAQDSIGCLNLKVISLMKGDVMLFNVKLMLHSLKNIKLPHLAI